MMALKKIIAKVLSNSESCDLRVGVNVLPQKISVD